MSISALNVTMPTQNKQKKSPRKPKTKETRIELRVNQKDKELIAKRAYEANLTVSEYLITCALRRKLPTPLMSKTDLNTYNQLTKLLNEINRIGVNFNQLTKNCHTQRKLGEPVVVDNNLLTSIEQKLDQTIAQLQTTMQTLHPQKLAHQDKHSI